MWLPKNKKHRGTGKMIVTDIIEGLGMWRLGASMGLRLTLTIFLLKVNNIQDGGATYLRCEGMGTGGAGILGTSKTKNLTRLEGCGVEALATAYR